MFRSLTYGLGFLTVLSAVEGAGEGIFLFGALGYLSYRESESQRRAQQNESGKTALAPVPDDGAHIARLAERLTLPSLRSDSAMGQEQGSLSLLRSAEETRWSVLSASPVSPLIDAPISLLAATQP